MDSGALDVVGVGDAVANVFSGGYAPPRRIGGGGRRGVRRGGYAARCNDADFSSAEFAQVADQCCQGHSLAFAVGAFAQEERFPDFAVFEELRWKLFAAEANLADEVDDSVDFSSGLVVGCGGGGLEWSLYDGVDFLDGAQ